MGVVLTSVDGEKIQCHICGELFIDLSFHIFKKHNLKVDEYKESFGIAKETGLISEEEKNRRKKKTMAWLSNMTKDQMIEYRKKLSEMGKKGSTIRKPGQPKEALESKNKKGTCPDQLLSKIKDVAEKLEHTPTLTELIRETGSQELKRLIFNMFGSYSNALRLLKFIPERVISPGFKRKYSNEELLEYLRIFVEDNGRLPTSVDCRIGGFLPSEDTYKRHFGSLVKARDIAMLNDNYSPDESEFQNKMINYQTLDKLR